MKTGIKVPFDIFSEKISENSKKLCDLFGGAEGYIAMLSKYVDNIEISAVKPDSDPKQVMYAMDIIRKHGLSMTIHGTLDNASDAETFFVPYLPILESHAQEMYNITVHPYDSPLETERILTDVCKYIDKNKYPVRITLENQRFSDECRIHSMCRDVAEVVRRINSEHLYNCYDFGHHLSNIRKFGDRFDVCTDRFLDTVKHTHIHSLFEGRTHFPLNCGEVLLEQNLTELIKRNYDGIWLLELMPERYDERFDPERVILDSVSVLKTALHQVKCKLEHIAIYQNEYPEILKSTFEKLEKGGDGIAVLAPSAYILKLGNTKLAIDVSVKTLPVSQKAREVLADILAHCDAAIVTHDHGDHFDRELMSGLPGDVTLYLPDFLEYENGKTVRIKNSDIITIGDMETEIFESAHSAGENNVPEYGFAVKYRGGYYVFPTDVRDYKKEHKIFENTKLLMSHLWLGRRNALNLYDNKYIEDFTKFIGSFGAETILMGHLYDVHREIDDMWTDIHTDKLRKTFDGFSNVTVGTYIEF